MGFLRHLNSHQALVRGWTLVFLIALSLPAASLAGTPGAAHIEIFKDTVPNGPQDFHFSVTGGPTAVPDFDLDDDSDSELSRMNFVEVVAGTYVVTEDPVPGFILTEIDCSDPTMNSSVDLGAGTATMVVDGTETVSCTFENTEAGKLIIDKVTEPAGDETAFDFDVNIVESSTVASFSLADQDAPTELFLLPGIYEVIETVPAGWALIDDSCTEGFTDDIDLSAGEEITCTFVNRTTDESDVVFSKAFAPQPIGPGSTTTLTFTIDNSANATPAGLLTFSDTLPVELMLADPALAFTDCGGGAIIDAPDGGSTISMSFGSVGAFDVCTVTVNVTSTIAGEGPFTNTSGPLTSTTGSSGTAEADLTVDADLPGFSKDFSPSTIPLGGTSTLTFTIDNLANGSAETLLFFVDDLPPGIVVATPANIFTDCDDLDPGAAMVTIGATEDTESPDGQRITFSGGSVAAGGDCTVSLDVTAEENGVFDNVSLELLSGGGSDPSGFATAKLEVPVEDLVKFFVDDPVPPGGVVTLRFIVTNTDRDFPATAIAFDDDLDPLGGLTGLAPSGPLPIDPCGEGSMLAFAAGTGVLSLTGGTLGPGDSCQFDVELVVPAAAPSGVFPNTTTALTAMIDGEGYLGNMASDDLVVSPAPIFTKEFIDDPAPAGGTVTVRFTLTNTLSTTGFADLAFSDDLETAFPGFAANVFVDGDTDDPEFDVCGTGSKITVFNPPDIMIGPITIVTPPDPTILEFSGGSLAPAGSPGDSCFFDVVLDIPTGIAGGIYTNTTGDLTGELDPAGDPIVGRPASGDVEILGAPRLTKEFTDDPVLAGGTVTLEFTIEHDEGAAGDATAIAFSDDLTMLTPAVAGLEALAVGSNSCTGSVVDISTPTLIDFSGGVLTPGETCSFSVTLTVPGTALSGPHTNATSEITATVDGVPGATGPAAVDDLLVKGLELTKEFVDDPVFPGDVVTLEFTITNATTGEDFTSITFDDDLDETLDGLKVVSPTPVLEVCDPDGPGGDPGTGTLTTSAGDTFLTVTGAALDAGESCTFSVDLLVPGSAMSGTYVNTTKDFFGSSGGPLVAFENATDDLVVNNVFLVLTKEFIDDPVAPGGTATLRFTITNLDPDTTVEEIAFSDDLDAALDGLEATAAVNGCGGMAAGGFPTGFFDYSGGSVAGGATCTIDLTLSVPVGIPVGTQVFNQTSGVTGFLGVEGPAVVGDPASDTLRIGFLTLEKAFDSPVKAGETVDLTFTLTNLGASAASMLGFSDDLESVLSGLLATGLPFAACGGTVQTFDGGSTIVFTDGSLAAAGSPGDSCMFTVTLSVPAEAPFGSFPNVTSDLSQAGLDVADPAEDDLVVEPPIDFSKAFSPDPIGPGSTTTLTFTIANIDSGALAEEVAFTDVLPAGMVIATPSSAFTDCTDAILSAPDGGTTISLSDARVGLGTTCTVTVNVTAAAPGEYDNVSGELTSTAGSGGTAEATLVVDSSLPGFSKAFDPAVIPPGGTSTLTFTIDLSAATEGEDNFYLEFTDLLPAGLVVATPSNAATDCECLHIACSTTVTADPGTGVITLVAVGSEFFEAPLLEAGSICTVDVDVTAASDDLYENVTLELDVESDFDVQSAGFATALLDVREGFLIKSFTDDPVPPGGTVTMEITINNPSRDFPATDITFTDDLDAVLPGTPDLSVAGMLPTDPCGAGSTLTVEPVNVLTLMGGSLPAEGSCTFSVTLDVPVGAATGVHDNTTSSIMATIDGETVVGDPASDDLRVVSFPIFTKEFRDAVTDDPDPVVGAGDDVVMRFTITNTSTTSAATDVAFFDELTTFLPYPVSATLPAAGFCGAGSTAAIVEPFTETHVLSVTGGMLTAAGMAGDSCTFDVTLTLPAGFPQGTYVNTTDEITAMVDGAAIAGPPASDSFDVVAAPRLTKEFLDDPVQPGSTVELEFTLEHDALAPGDAVDVEFTDDLAAVLPGAGDLAAAAGELPLADLCGPGNGMLVGTAGDTLLTFSGATLTPGQICTFSLILDVPADADAGSHINKTSNVVATVLGVETTENQAEDDLMVGGVVLVKEFTDDPVIAGDTVTLEFVITNQTSDPVTDIFFEDLLDPDVLDGLTVTTPMPLVDPCGSGSMLEIFSAPEVTFPPSAATPAIDEALRLTGGSLGPTGPMEGDGACTFSVTLMVPASTPSGTYPNRTRDFEATIDAMTLPFPDAQDDLVVASEQLLLTKEFIDDPVVPGGTVTLELGISTLGGESAAADLAFTDDLEAALAGLAPNEPLPKAACGGTLDFAAGVLTFSGGSFAGGDCGISVTLEVPMAVPFGTTITNTTSSLTGTIGGLGATGEPASDDLMVDFFTFEKFFDGLTKPTGTPMLTFMITNLSTMDTVTDLGFTDNLDAVIPGLVATSLPAEPCGVGSSITGTSTITMTGGTLLPGGSCSFDVELLVPPDSGGGSFLNTTSDLEVLGLAVASPATALLDVDPPPSFDKVFLPDFIAPGFNSTLSFLIDNSASLFDVTDLTFTDVLPAGVTVSLEDSIFNDCGGVLTAIDGSGSIGLTGGSVLAGDFCVIQVGVTATTPGIYVNTSGPLTSSSGETSAAIDTLTVVDVGGACLAPDGEDIAVDGDTYLLETEIVVCKTALFENIGVLGPDGHLIVRAGLSVAFGEGTVIGADGKLTVVIDPVLNNMP